MHIRNQKPRASPEGSLWLQIWSTLTLGVGFQWVSLIVVFTKKVSIFHDFLSKCCRSLISNQALKNSVCNILQVNNIIQVNTCSVSTLLHIWSKFGSHILQSLWVSVCNNERKIKSYKCSSQSVYKETYDSLLPPSPGGSDHLYIVDRFCSRWLILRE